MRHTPQLILEHPSQGGPEVMSQAPQRLVIGVRDSGVGGLTVARCIKRVLPKAQLLYFADTAHVPYGVRTAAEVRHYALSISRFLIEQGAMIVVFACNTSSALALEMARDTFDVPIIGTIQPGSRAAISATQNGRIGVLATQATVDSGVYKQSLLRLDPQLNVLEVACPDFVPLVENEQVDGWAAHEAARRYVAALQEFGGDTILLGCTHYPLLIGALRAAAPEIAFVDPAEAVAHAVAAQAGKMPDTSQAAGLRRVNDIFFCSGDGAGLSHWIAQLLPQGAPELREGPCFDYLSTT